MPIQYCFWLTLKHFSIYLADSFCITNCLWIINPIYFLDISSVSEFLTGSRFVKIRLWSITSETKTINTSQCRILSFKISTVNYDKFPSSNVCTMHTWILFGVFFCWNRNFMTTCSSTLCWNGAVNNLKQIKNKHKDSENCHFTL